MPVQGPMIMEWQRDSYIVSTDPRWIDREIVHQYLSEASYWAKNIPFDVVSRSIEHSLCFGLYEDGQEMIGFARILSDYATFAYILDVFILPPNRGVGLSKWLMECVFAHPDLQNLRGWLLKTQDAHGLYQKFGFQLAKHPEKIMERVMLHPYAEH